jgi:nicotinamide-nucleotide amidase
MTSCCDEERDITDAVTTAAGRADVVICSGGLGPTEDDLTVDVLAALVGRGAVIDEPARKFMEARFAQRIAVTPIQLRQVRVPEGARVYANAAGLAPGFEVAVAGVPVICMPGVPRELQAIFEGHVRARLGQMDLGEKIARRIYRVFGRGESQISQACRGIVDGVAGATIHYQVKFPETLVKLVVRDSDAAAAEARLDAMDAQVHERLTGNLYGTGEENLLDRVSKRLLASGKTVATAESCTGGMLGEMLTRMPGMSRAFIGGAICYANREKARQLGVAQATLEAHGAVSEQCVRQMAEGARARFSVDIALAVTGIAGPDGGTADKPVGLVWLAAASARGTNVKQISWPGARDQIRTLASWWAFRLLDDELSV